MPVATRRGWYRPMRGRDIGEQHRAGTPLELLFDLCFVVAVAQTAGHLHDAVREHHFAFGLVAYLMVFFAIWWAWMNFTWFASAYDTDDVPYRLATLVQIAGTLILAAGVPRAFDDKDFGIVTLGYVVMRLALVTQWIRAAREDPDGRPTAIRYAVGLTVCQIGWILLLLIPHESRLPFFLLMVLAEIAVPLWAARVGRTMWHPGHIAERYGLFTLIVLGETVLAATLAVQTGLDAGVPHADLLLLAGSGLVVVFAMWWLYFDQPASRILVSERVAFVWGYGHYLIFASAAAVGAGLQVAVDHAVGAAHLSSREAGAAIAIPVAVFLLSVWFLHVRPQRHGLVQNAAFLGAAAVVLASTTAPQPLPLIAVALTALVTVCVLELDAGSVSAP